MSSRVLPIAGTVVMPIQMTRSATTRMLFMMQVPFFVGGLVWILMKQIIFKIGRGEGKL
jgi:anaerobic C4-dicarboxylate transporter